MTTEQTMFGGSGYESSGDMITMDHANANALIHGGLGGERQLLVVSDLATGYLEAFPVPSKTPERVLSSLLRYLGHDRARAFHTDRAPELIAAVRDLPPPPPPVVAGY